MVESARSQHPVMQSDSTGDGYPAKRSILCIGDRLLSSFSCRPVGPDIPAHFLLQHKAPPVIPATRADTPTPAAPRPVSTDTIPGQYWKQNHLRNWPVQYSIYYMNHGKEVYITSHTTLDLSHRKFAVRYTPRLWLGVYLLQTSSDLGLG